MQNPKSRRVPLTKLATTSGLRYQCGPEGSGCSGRGQPACSGAPNSVCTPSMSSSESITWLGAGKIHGFQPMALYAASQVKRTSSQIASRLRLPESFAHLGVDTVDLVFDFLSDQSHEPGDVRARP